MTNSAIDALLQVVAPARSGDGAARAVERGAFRPALEQALAADSPHAPAVADALAEAESEYDGPALEQDSNSVEHDASHTADDEAAEVPSAEEAADDDSAAEDDAADEVEISEAAEGAAVATQSPAVEQTSRVKAVRGEAEVDLVAVNKRGEATQQAHASQEAPASNAQNTSAAATADAETLKTRLAAEGEAPKATRTRSPKGDGRRHADGPDKEAQAAVRPRAQQTVVPARTKQPADGDDDAAADERGARPANHAERAESASLAPSADAEQADSDRGDAKKPAAAARTATLNTEAAIAAPIEAPAALERKDSEQTDQAVAKPNAVDAAPAPSGPRGAASLDRLAAPKALHPNGPPANGDAGLQVDRARFVGRVEGAMRAAHQREGRVNVRLAPPELGSLRIEIVMHNGGLTAHVEAETSAARNLLLDNLPALRERLAEQNLRVEKFDVDVRRDGGGQTSGGGPQDGRADQPGWGDGDGRRPPAPPRETAPVRGPRPAPIARITDAELDVRV